VSTELFFSAYHIWSHLFQLDAHKFMAIAALEESQCCLCMGSAFSSSTDSCPSCYL